MVSHFDYSTAAKAGGLSAGDLKRLEACIRKQHVSDDMLFELRMLRTVRAIVDGGVTVDGAIEEFGAGGEHPVNGKPPFDEVWERIVSHQGETFRQIRGGEFVYAVQGNSLVPDRTNHQFGRKQIEEAYSRMPVDGPGELQDLRGPSYLFAVLMDDRVRMGQW